MERLKLIFNNSDLPDKEENPKFWQFINDPYYRIVLNYMLLREVRKSSLEKLSMDDKLSQLAKIKALQELIDLSVEFNDEPLDLP